MVITVSPHTRRTEREPRGNSRGLLQSIFLEITREARHVFGSSQSCSSGAVRHCSRHDSGALQRLSGRQEVIGAMWMKPG